MAQMKKITQLLELAKRKENAQFTVKGQLQAHGSKKNTAVLINCKTVVFFANASDCQYSNERSGASLKTARENGDCGRVRLARFTREDHAYGASRLSKTSEVYCAYL